MEEEPAQGIILPEIVNFFEERYGKTLVIKETPGSGKRVFALTMLSMLKRDGVYLSTRVDPDTLYMLFPWIKEKIAAENIVDATQSERPSKSTTLTGIKPLKYTDVPEFLKSVYTRTEKMETPIVIIDSWDAVVSHAGYYEPKEREKLEHNLCDFARRTNTNMIFVVEYTEQRPLDYLTDGVIVTESELFEGRRLRKMQIQKLRGCSVKDPVVLFTLYNGTFKSFRPIKSIEIQNPAIPIQEQEPINDTSATTISTGINDLDLAIGGYGNFNIIEGDYIRK
jgi:KaiC/GvpD/RAD55 family RecA-like ATPase